MTQAGEIESLKAEIARLRAMQAESEWASLVRTRHDEYRQRISALEAAAASSVDPPDQPDKTAVPQRHFFDLIRQVDVRRVIDVVTEVHEKGYAVVPGLLDEAQVMRLRETLAPIYDHTRRLYAEQGNTRGNQTIHVQNILAKTRAADEVATQPLLRAVIAGILGADFILNAGVVAMSPDPGCSPQGLHRDDGFYTLFPRPHMPLVVTAAVALDDFHQDNGSTRIISGSVLWPTSRAPAKAEGIYPAMPAGSMLLWDGAVWHGGGGNSTSRPRRTVTVNYTRGWLRTQFNQYLSIPRETVLTLPAELQSDLGYHRSGTGLGGCDYEDPLKYLRRLQALGGDGAQARLGLESRLPDITAR